MPRSASLTRARWTVAIGVALLAAIGDVAVHAAVVNFPLDAVADPTSNFYTYWSEGVAQLNRPWANTNRQPFWSTKNPTQTYNSSFDFFPNDSAMQFGQFSYDDAGLTSGSGTASITDLILGIEIDPLEPTHINGTWLSFSTDLTTYSGTVTVVNNAVTSINLTANYNSTGYFGSTAINASGQFTVTGDQFKVLASGYNPVLGASFNPSLAWNWTGTILDPVQPPADDADFNGDGLVDAADYTVLRDTLTATGLTPHTLGDANGDGAVTSADYEIWKSQFGGPPPAGFAAASVPEPASVVIATIAATILTLANRVTFSVRRRT